MSSCSARFFEKSSSGFWKMATRLVSLSTISLGSPSLFGSLKSGKSLLERRALASTSGAMIWVLILSPMSGLPLRAIMSVNEAPGGMTTGGAKSSEFPYLSLMYLINSMNRT